LLQKNSTAISAICTDIGYGQVRHQDAAL